MSARRGRRPMLPAETRVRQRSGGIRGVRVVQRAQESAEDRKDEPILLSIGCLLRSDDVAERGHVDVRAQDLEADRPTREVVISGGARRLEGQVQPTEIGYQIPYPDTIYRGGIAIERDPVRLGWTPD